MVSQRYQSRERNQRISKTLDMPQNTVKAIVNKRRKQSSPVTSPRTGRPLKGPDRNLPWSHQEMYSNIKGHTGAYDMWMFFN